MSGNRSLFLKYIFPEHLHCSQQTVQQRYFAHMHLVIVLLSHSTAEGISSFFIPTVSKCCCICCLIQEDVVTIFSYCYLLLFSLAILDKLSWKLVKADYLYQHDLQPANNIMGFFFFQNIMTLIWKLIYGMYGTGVRNRTWLSEAYFQRTHYTTEAFCKYGGRYKQRKHCSETFKVYSLNTLHINCF